MCNSAIKIIESDIMSFAQRQRASKTHDRHFSESEDVVLTDHLIQVKETCINLLSKLDSDFQLELHIAIENSGLSLDCLKSILIPVALLHDIGKVEDNKALEIIHPVSGKRSMQQVHSDEKKQSEFKIIHCRFNYLYHLAQVI